jgi:hypothetical protein
VNTNDFRHGLLSRTGAILSRRCDNLRPQLGENHDKYCRAGLPLRFPNPF